MDRVAQSVFCLFDLICLRPINNLAQSVMCLTTDACLTTDVCLTTDASLFQSSTAFVNILCGFFLSCVCYVFVRVCLYVLCGHLLGKG